jgi:hypothetical protein
MVKGNCELTFPQVLRLANTSNERPRHYRSLKIFVANLNKEPAMFFACNILRGTGCRSISCQDMPIPCITDSKGLIPKKLGMLDLQVL